MLGLCLHRVICAMMSTCSMLTWKWVLMFLEPHVIADQITSNPLALFSLTICFFTFSLCLKMLPCCILYATNDLTLAAVTSFEAWCQNKCLNVDKAKSPLHKSLPQMQKANLCFNLKQKNTADISHFMELMLCCALKVLYSVEWQP